MGQSGTSEPPLELAALQPLVGALAEGGTSWRELAERAGMAAPQLARLLAEVGVFADADAALSQDPPRPDPPLRLLSPTLLEREVPDPWQLELHWSIDSTNLEVMRQLLAEPERRLLCLAEHQGAGRGRRGRSWVGALARNLMLSLGCSLPAAALRTGGLSLAAGAVACRVLEQLGYGARSGRRLGLKWPNDLILDDAKLGGILVETQTLAGQSRAALVLGIGINCSLPQSLRTGLERPVAQLRHPRAAEPDRNDLVARLAPPLIRLLEGWSADGFERWRDDFERLHLWRGRWVQAQTGEGEVLEGTVQGVGDNGELLLRGADGQLLQLGAGEISLGSGQGSRRKTPDPGIEPDR